jgi:hypothetical protein
VARRPSAVIAAEWRCPAETKMQPISSVERMLPAEAEKFLEKKFWKKI